MAQINVDEENICFSSARSMFEKSTSDRIPKPEAGRSRPNPNVGASGKGANSDNDGGSGGGGGGGGDKGPIVVSTATLKRRQAAPARGGGDDGANNSNNNLTADRKLEISVVKVTGVIKESSAGTIMAGRHVAPKGEPNAIGSGKQERRNFSGGRESLEESKKTISFDTENSPKATHPGAPTNPKAKQHANGSSKPQDVRQHLMDDIINFSGSLRKTAKPRENKPLEANNQEPRASEENHSRPTSSHLESKVIPPQIPNERRIPAPRSEDTRQCLLNDIVNAAGRTLRKVPEPRERRVYCSDQVPVEPVDLNEKQETGQLGEAEVERKKPITSEDLNHVVKSVNQLDSKSISFAIKTIPSGQYSDYSNPTADRSRVAPLASSRASCDVSLSAAIARPSESRCTILKANATNGASSTPGQHTAVSHSSTQGDKEKIEQFPSSTLQPTSKFQAPLTFNTKTTTPATGGNKQSETLNTTVKSQASLTLKTTASTPTSASKTQQTTPNYKTPPTFNIRTTTPATSESKHSEKLEPSSKSQASLTFKTTAATTATTSNGTKKSETPSPSFKSQSLLTSTYTATTTTSGTKQSETLTPILKSEAPLTFKATTVTATTTLNGTKQSETLATSQAPLTFKATTTTTTATTRNGDKQNNAYYEEEEEEEEHKSNSDRISERLLLRDWDPTKLLEKLYTVNAAGQDSACKASSFLNKCGYMECLPISKTKDTFLKTWKRKFFRAQDGKLCFYEGSKESEESGKLELGGGCVEDIGPRVLGIEDGRGHYLVVRCPTEKEALEWKASIGSQIEGDVSNNWIQPLTGGRINGSISESTRIVIIDIGSSSVRAGILDTHPSMPTLVFPNVVATRHSDGSKVYGFEALKPSIRSTSTISCPVRPSNKVEKYSLDWESLPGLFRFIFHQLRLQPHQCSVMFCAPTTFNKQTKWKFMEMFFETLRVRSVSVMRQTLLALYSYNVDTGIVVDVGEKIEILPVFDGFVVDGCIGRLPLGGQRVCEAFNSHLTDRKCLFSNEAEMQLVKYAVQKLCYVSMDYGKDLGECLVHTAPYRKTLPLDSLDLPPEAAEPITADLACFQSTEGFFDMAAWGVDSPPLQQLILKVISNCPIDSRRQMWRNIYLSGGVTMLPNFKERLEVELTKLTTANVAVQVHASPYRYHACYLGACVLGNMEAFRKFSVTIDEWTTSAGACAERMVGF